MSGPSTRFALARTRPELASALDQRPAGSRAWGELALAMGFLWAGFVAVGAAALLGVATLGLVVGVGLGATGAYLLREAWRVRVAPLVRALAIIVDHHTVDVDGMRRHRLTLELEDGHRVEYDCPPRIADRFAIGDLGVAYARHDQLLDFVRVVA